MIPFMNQKLNDLKKELYDRSSSCLLRSVVSAREENYDRAIMMGAMQSALMLGALNGPDNLDNLERVIGILEKAWDEYPKKTKEK